MDACRRSDESEVDVTRRAYAFDTKLDAESPSSMTLSPIGGDARIDAVENRPTDVRDGHGAVSLRDVGMVEEVNVSRTGPSAASRARLDDSMCRSCSPSLVSVTPHAPRS